MVEHTPGPWKCDGKIVAWADPSCISIIATTDIGGNDGQTQRADARLIAAAPEMLAALRAVNKLVSEAAMTGFNCHDGDWAERLFFSQQATSNAIAKAEGRS